jgi:winged helix DNA-binding protein
MVTAGGSLEVGLLRLAAQRIVGEPFPGPVEAVRWLTALQAQDATGALTSVALRTTGRSVDDVRSAFQRGEVVKSWPLRGTLHLVAAEDLAWMLPVFTPRVISAARKRHSDLGISERDVEETRSATVELLSGGRAVSRGDLFEAWEQAGQRTAGQRGSHLLWYLAQTGTVCFGPVRNGEQMIVLVAEWLPHAQEVPPEQARAELALRYFRGRGPASLTDLVAWARLSLTEARAALAAVRPQLEIIVRDGEELFLDPATPELLARFRREARGVVLLPGFDEFVLGYRDRRDVMTPEDLARIVPGGNGVFRPTVVSGGRVIGTWRRSPGFAAELFTDVPASTEKSLRTAAGRLPAPGSRPARR